MSARKSIRAGCLQEPQYTRSSMSLQIQQRFREISQMPVYFNLPYKGHFNSSLKWKGVGRFISLASDLMCLQFLLRAMEFFKLWGFWCRALSGSQNERKWSRDLEKPWVGGGVCQHRKDSHEEKSCHLDARRFKVLHRMGGILWGGQWIPQNSSFLNISCFRVQLLARAVRPAGSPSLSSFARLSPN